MAPVLCWAQEQATRATLTVTNDSFAGDSVGVQNNELGVTANATLRLVGQCQWSDQCDQSGRRRGEGDRQRQLRPLAGRRQLRHARFARLFRAQPPASMFLAPSGSTFQGQGTGQGTGAGLGIALGGNPVAVIPGGGTVTFVGNGGTVNITGESGSPDVFTINDTSVVYSAADGLAGTTIVFAGTGMTRNVTAQGTSNTFNIVGAGRADRRGAWWVARAPTCSFSAAHRN